MTISSVVKAALNKIGKTLPELSKGYNGLLADVQLGDAIEDSGKSGSVTLTSGTTSVVTDTSVKAGDKIFIQATDAKGAALVAAAAGVYISAISAGVSFTITHPTADATEVFNYNISR